MICESGRTIWCAGAVQDQWLYVYLLIEFQSTVDRFMAVRLLTYVGLLYQDLIKSKQLPRGKKTPSVPHRANIMARSLGRRPCS